MQREVCIAAIGLIVSLSTSISAQAGAIVVARNSAIDAVNTEEARKIFLGREAIVAGQPLTVIYNSDGATRAAFESRVLGKTGADLNTYWAKLIFTGKANAPVEASGDTAVKSKISSVPGAIGYISDAAIDDSLKMLMKY